MTQSGRPNVLDVSKLPTVAFGERAPLFWGLIVMTAIEGTMFVLLFATYFYVRGNYDVFPPSGVGKAAFHASIAGMASLAASVLPMILVDHAARRGRVREARRWLLAATSLGLAFLCTRAVEIQAIPFRWDDHAYGSVFWTILGMHTFHGVAASAENVMFCVFLFVGRVEKKHLVDLHVNAVYWYFVVGVWAPLWAVLYFDNVLAR